MSYYTRSLNRYSHCASVKRKFVYVCVCGLEVTLGCLLLGTVLPCLYYVLSSRPTMSNCVYLSHTHPTPYPTPHSTPHSIYHWLGWVDWPPRDLPVTMYSELGLHVLSSGTPVLGTEHISLYFTNWIIFQAQKKFILNVVFWKRLARCTVVLIKRIVLFLS